MVWPWLGSSNLGITELEITHLRNSTFAVHKSLCISKTPALATQLKTHKHSRGVGRGQSSPVSEKINISGSFLSLHLPPLNSLLLFLHMSVCLLGADSILHSLKRINGSPVAQDPGKNQILKDNVCMFFHLYISTQLDVRLILLFPHSEVP